MKLRIRFSSILPFYNIKDNDNKATQCVEIAEDFAIGFAEWCKENNSGLINKETLEIYKKENEL